MAEQKAMLTNILYPEIITTLTIHYSTLERDGAKIK